MRNVSVLEKYRVKRWVTFYFGLFILAYSVRFTLWGLGVECGPYCGMFWPWYNYLDSLLGFAMGSFFVYEGLPRLVKLS